MIDDEPQIRRFVAAGLELYDYSVSEAEKGATGLSAAAHMRPDLIILDLVLPDINGFEVLKTIRSWSNVPVIVLSIEADEEQKVLLLRGGADDYVSKPFRMEEVLARIRALIRRASGLAQSELRCGALAVDVRNARVSVGGHPVKLTSHEFRVLSYLMHHNRVVSRAELTEHIYAQDFDRDSNTVEVFIARLRRKLGAPFIETVRGLGYRMAEPPTGGTR